MRRAVIDVGTNSVKLLVAEVDGAAVYPLWEASQQTRLGQGFYESQLLQPGAIEQTAGAVAKFAVKARELDARSIRVIATSAARDAANQKELLTAILSASGLAVEVISGEQEADWVFEGVRSDPALAGHALLILDVGGGSSEFILSHGVRRDFRGSFPIGTVRLLELIQPADPPTSRDWDKCRDWLGEALTGHVKPALEAALSAIKPEPVIFVGTGGTTSILAAMELELTAFDRERIEQVCLARERIEHFCELLWRLPLAKRRTLPGLPPNRADVILFGVAVFARAMESLGFERVRASTRGLRFGAVMG